MVRKVTKKQMVALVELQRSCVKTGETCSRSTITATLHQSGLYGTVARRKPLRLEFAPKKINKKIHLKNSQTVRNNLLSQTVTHGGGSIMLWGVFSAAGTGSLVRIEGKLNRAKYRDMLKENSFQSAQGQRITFQQDNDLNQTAKT